MHSKNFRNKKQAEKKQPDYTRSEIEKYFGISSELIDNCFPKPACLRICHSDKHLYIPAWSRSQVKKALDNPKFKSQSFRKKASTESLYIRDEIKSKLAEYGIDRMQKRALSLSRKFVLHIGATNSGKTYHALNALKAAYSGVYLGPLRLLALEMFDTMNQSGIPCSLLTGEESIVTENAKHTASTIEMADFENHYECAVIDEAQMIADSHRGDKWLKAIFELDADEIQICLAPEAKEVVCSILQSFAAPYTVINHERLTPLQFSGRFRHIKDAMPGDALIVFSRKSVLAVSAELEHIGISTSVIYGALPPASRKEEVRRFTDGESSVVVSTDAIGMGISLPIRRIIFCETTKFDGKSRRYLRSGEIKQIAGRAGRFGKFDLGEVLTMSDEDHIRVSLSCTEKQYHRITLPFPEEILEHKYPLDMVIDEWNKLPKVEGISRVDLTDALILYKALKPYSNGVEIRQCYDLITCPVDVKRDEAVKYWLECSRCIFKKKPLPQPTSGFETLEQCEIRYQQLDIRHQLLRKIGIEENRTDEKAELCEMINNFLNNKGKEEYLRHCSQCGRIMPSTAPYTICNKCLHKTSI